MDISFNLNYHTTWGQIVYITGSEKSLGAFDKDKALAMRYNSNGHWSLQLEFPDDQAPFEYRYIVKEYGTVNDTEWGDSRSFSPNSKNSNYVLYDHWQNTPPNKAFYSSAFTQSIFRRQPADDKLKTYGHSITFRIFAPRVKPDETLGIVGSIPPLGTWDASKAKVMNDDDYPQWEICLNASEVIFPFEYKFILLDRQSGDAICWEDGDNRYLNIDEPPHGTSVIVSGMRFDNPTENWKGAGVAIPVFSLRSESGFGVGEFNDLKKLTDWVVATGQRVIQVLPVNDTTMTHSWTDSYPYNTNSIFALHPIYLNLESIGILKDKDSMEAYDRLRKELNLLDEIDYERVSLTKWSYFKAIFAENGKKTLESPEFQHFFEENREWLIPYAAFCFLRDMYKTPDFKAWKTYSVFNLTDVEELCARHNFHYNEIAIHFFLQFHLHKQLKEASRYAREKGVILKGDIPIGISRHSADAWTNERLFNMDAQAGAPPDAFSNLGQNWGFPTYNWEEMAKDGYEWWKKRFRKMAEYFEAYRIDHILGFFRIWEIPESSVQGLLGHFNPALPFTRDEMSGYGFYFDEYRHTQPYIRHYFLYDFFGEYTEEVILNYLSDIGYEAYELKPQFNTQQKIEAHFSGKDDAKSIQIKGGLFGLANEVLFVSDSREKGRFHPRISAQYTYSYRALNDYERWCYDRLYVDFFYHRHNEFWRNEALKKLPPLISATDMLTCGEDLGMIPACVPDVMHELQILSLEIQRMPKDPAYEFADTYHYPYLSVCTTSTHDMATLRGWWEENRENTQNYYNHILHEHGIAPYYCEPWICNRIIDQHLQSPSMLAILPMQDWLSTDETMRREKPEDERINIPAVTRHYWRYRMHLNLEDLLGNEKFNRRLHNKLLMHRRR